MLNNFCFHVYAQKSLFIGENVMFFFDLLILTLPCEFPSSMAKGHLPLLRGHLQMS